MATPDDVVVTTSKGYSWPLSYATNRDCSELIAFEEDDRKRIQRMAADYLDAWTEYQFGTIERVVGVHARETKLNRPPIFEGRGPISGLISPPAFPSDCITDDPRSLRLSRVLKVHEVMINGEPFTGYRVDGDVLIRTDGVSWPIGSEGFTVRYLHGTEVPDGGQIAAGILSCEFAKALQGAHDCQLPERVQSITRQGVSVTVMDQFEDLDKGHTGIWLIDSWVASVTIPKTRSSVMSPDYRRKRAHRTYRAN